MGRTVTLTMPPLMEGGFFPKGPASVCLEPPPNRQCYTAPKGFGRDASDEVIELDKSTKALLFRAANGGVSGWSIHLALLLPVSGDSLDDLFSYEDVTLSNQSEYGFWKEHSFSPWPLFVTADYIWGPGEAHYDAHRIIVSAYMREFNSATADQEQYYLADRYMTARKYDLDKRDILDLEKQEIFARLRRVIRAGGVSPLPR